MGILDRLFGPAKKGSSGLFNQANHHWQVMKEALLKGDDTKAQWALLEVVRLCQEAIAADPQKEGNAYVLLTNALLRASQVFPATDEELLIRYAAACIHTWWTLPHKSWPITSKNNYELGIRWFQEIQQKMHNAGSANPEATMAEYVSLYGGSVTSPSGFESVRATLVRNPEELREQELREEVAHWSREAERDPENPTPWSILARKYEELGQYKETERALLKEAELAKRENPNIKTADWSPNVSLGLLYAAAVSTAIRTKGIVVWGSSPSPVTLNALGYTLEQAQALAKRQLEAVLQVAQDTGMGGVLSYFMRLAQLRSALKAVDTMDPSHFDEYDQIV